MAQDLLVTVHRLSRRVAPLLGPLRGVARTTFARLMQLRYGDGGLTVAVQNDRRWKLIPEVALRGEHQEFETVEWFRQVVRPGMQVLDVGANVGQMSLELGALVGPQGRVVAIEPAQGNLQALKTHIEANGMGARIDVVPAACASEHGGQMSFFVAGARADSVGSGHAASAEGIQRAHPSIAVHEVRVPRVSIDGLCAERALRPSLIKIDVEGGELGVLAGARQTIASCRPLVRLAFHPFAFESPLEASDEVRRFFEGFDYELRAPEKGALALEEYVALPRREIR